MGNDDYSRLLMQQQLAMQNMYGQQMNRYSDRTVSYATSNYGGGSCSSIAQLISAYPTPVMTTRYETQPNRRERPDEERYSAARSFIRARNCKTLELLNLAAFCGLGVGIVGLCASLAVELYPIFAIGAIASGIPTLIGLLNLAFNAGR